MSYISFKIRSDMLVTPKSSCTFSMLAQIFPVFLLLKCEHQRFYILQLILDTFHIYTKSKKKDNLEKCLIIFNQSHVYKLVIFLEFTLFNLVFSCFSLAFLKFSLILSYFCFSLIIVLDSL